MIAMLALFRDSATQALPLTPKPAPGPDYAGLVDILIDLQPPDNAGEIIIDADEASRIRRAGWTARAGVWRCPTIPPEFLGLYPPLWHLRDDIDPASRPISWHPKRAAFIRPSYSPDDLGKLDRRILKLLAIHALSRIGLQRRLWRIPASVFNHVLDRLIIADRITVHDGLLHPFSRHQFDLRRERAARPKLPVPIYTSP